MKNDPSNVNQRIGTLTALLRNAQLIWRLLIDARVSPWLKLIPFITLLYLISPIDFIPDLLFGPGQFDDLGVILFGLWLFVALAPKEVVREHTEGPESVDVSYRVVDEEPKPGPEPISRQELPAPKGDEAGD